MELEDRILFSASPVRFLGNAVHLRASNHSSASASAADHYVHLSEATVTNALQQIKHVNVVLIDSQLTDSAQLIADAAPGAKVFVYNSQTDTAAQVLDRVVNWARATGSTIDDLALVSHGAGGAFELGNQWITATSLSQTAPSWQKLSSVLAAGANIEIFGCNVAQEGSYGQELLNDLSTITHAAVYSSTDTTGAGGNWVLEAASLGTSAAALQSSSIPLNTSLLASYAGTLSTIAVDTTTSASTASGGAASLTFSHTVNSGSNGLLVVEVAIRSGASNQEVSSVTYGGQSLTFVGLSQAANNEDVEIWSVVAPTIGTANVVVNLTASSPFAASATDYFNVNQTKPFGTVVSATGNNATPTATVSSASGQLVIDALAAQGNSGALSTTGTGQSKLWSQATGTSAGDALGGGSYNTGASSVTMAWSETSASNWAIVAVPLLPAVSGSTTTITVTTAADTLNSGSSSLASLLSAILLGTPVSLRDAITAINSEPAGTPTKIDFDISGGGLQTITLQSALPSITNTTTLDATTQPGYAGIPLIQINGTALGNAQNALIVDANNTTVQGFSIYGVSSGNGIEVSDVSGALVQANFIGLKSNGTVDGNGSGIVLTNATNTVIGGTSFADANFISGNSNQGIRLESGSNGNLVEGNRIGTNYAGNSADGNGQAGIEISNSANNTIGNITAGEGNQIAGNSGPGVEIMGTPSKGNVIEGNYIGTDETGTVALGNSGDGVEIDGGASDNKIGGTVSYAGNVISANGGAGVEITGNSTAGNLVEGNFIGPDMLGTAALGNAAGGVTIVSGASNNTIGSASSGNIISGNTGDGILVTGDNNQVIGNYVGIGSNQVAMANTDDGIDISGGTGNIVGGTANGAGNVISGNAGVGLAILSGANGTLVEGNYIGTNVAGTSAVANQSGGILISSSPDNTIGGSAAGDTNIISGNTGAGIEITGTGSTGNLIYGDWIGVNSTNTAALGNSAAGVEIDSYASNNSIGGTSAGQGNIIANNSGAGVEVLSMGATGDAIEGNSIYSNTGLGIDLNGDGVTPNHLGLTVGPNYLQNYPVITSAVVDGMSLTVAGELETLPVNYLTYKIDFYWSPTADASGYGQGKTDIGSTTIQANLFGFSYINATFSGVSVPAGGYVTATATDSSGNTSEFAADIAATGNHAPVLSGANNLTAINENASSNTGTLVSALISGMVTDADAGAVSGIAVTAVNNANGTWQYSTNGGSSWSSFSSPSNTSALLLASDANTYVRFVPNANWSGTVSNGITFRAWDQTSGTAGGTANTSTNGGTTAFSTATASSSIVVNQVNQPPSGTNNSVTIAEDSSYTFKASDFGFTDPNNPPSPFLAVKITTLPTRGLFLDNGVAVTAGQYVSVADINNNELTFTPATGFYGTGYASFMFQVQNSGGTANGGVDTDPSPKTLTVNVIPSGTAPTAVNDPGNQFYENQTSNVSAPGFLAGDTSYNGQSLTAEIVTLPTHGSIAATLVGLSNPTDLINNGATNYTESWSPDGTKLAFASNVSGSFQIYVMNADGSNLTRITNDNANDGFPVWSPDGTKIAFASNASGTFQIYVMNANGTHATQLTSNSVNNYQLAWSPDGTKIAFTSQLTGSPQIFTINAGGGGLTQLTNSNGANNYASWSPDGTKIAFTSTRDGTEQIYVMNSNGSNQTRLSNNSYNDSQPIWSPGGSLIAFISDRSGTDNLYVMYSNGSNQSHLSATTTAEETPAWSPDGMQIAMDSGGNIAVGSLLFNGAFSYTPNHGYVGTDSFNYVAYDGQQTSNVATVGLIVNPVTQPPQGTSNTVTTPENSGYTFSTNDFGFSDPNNSPGNSFADLEITTLPGAGKLTDNGVDIPAGSFVSVSDISAGKLVFTPDNDTSGASYASFTFQVKSSGSTANGGVNLDPSPKTMTVNVTQVNQAPQGTSGSVALDENGAYTFATSDFGFSDPNDSPANSLQAVKITTLPGAGALTDNGAAVNAGQFVSASDISSGKLVFTPAADSYGSAYASFTFQVQDNGGTAGGGVNLDPMPKTMTFNVLQVTKAPQGASNSITIQESTTYTFIAADFGFSDPNNNPSYALAAVKITTTPNAGSLTDNGTNVSAGQFVSAADINAGKLVFTPPTYISGSNVAVFEFQVQSTGSTANGGVNLDPAPKAMIFSVTPKKLSLPSNPTPAISSADAGGDASSSSGDSNAPASSSSPSPTSATAAAIRDMTAQHAKAATMFVSRSSAVSTSDGSSTRAMVDLLIDSPAASNSSQGVEATRRAAEKTVSRATKVDSALRLANGVDMAFTAADSPLARDLDSLDKQLQNGVHLQEFVVGTVATVSSSLSVGYVIWMIRSGLLLSSLVAQMPAWWLVDPLIVLSGSGSALLGSEDDAEESLASIIEQQSAEEEPAKQIEGLGIRD